MSNSNINILKQHRDVILEAEVGALIHNIGKFSEEFLRYQIGESGYEEFDYQAIVGITADLASAISLGNLEITRIKDTIDANQELMTSSLLSVDQKRWLKERSLNLPIPFDDHSYSLGDFIEFQKWKWYKPTKSSPPRISIIFQSNSRATELLEASHNAASGVEKEDAPKNEGRQLSWPLQYSSVFGFEEPIESGRFPDLRKNMLAALEMDTREKAFALASLTLEKAVGDTRYPINEVRLSDLSFSVAGLFKSALAQAIITKNWTQRDYLRWRLLRVNFDVLRLYAKGIKIADLVSYQEVVRSGCEAVKKLVEFEYPLGNEVYRDTSGIYFTFPDIDLPADLAVEIRHRVDEIEMELAPRIAVGTTQENTAASQLKHILADQREKAEMELAQPYSAHNLSPCWRVLWENLPDGKWEVCPVCRLRPMKEYRDACEHCLKRRISRVKTWNENPIETIWIDEIADHNGRVALIVGKFGLDSWISGDLVQTLLVKAAKNDPSGCSPKNPSPARLRRVWETAQRFWKETVEQNILATHDFSKGSKTAVLRNVRLAFAPDNKKGWKENIAYDGVIDERSICLSWNEQMKQFVTISNLQWLTDDKKELNDLAGRLRGLKIQLTDPENPRLHRSFIAQDVRPARDALSHYLPYLSLLASPDQFLVLIPAGDALSISNKIYKEYREQFRKVQNRLPLFLGVIFFQRKTPLAAALDTARRMLKESQKPIQAKLSGKIETVMDTNGWPKEVKVPLNIEGANSEINMKTLMGDGQTPDIWYPYWQVKGKPKDREHCFIGFDGEHWVHVKDLKKDDVVQVYPSTFAYKYLEYTAQRFEFDDKKDTMIIDELPRLQKMWENICRTPDMSNTKIQAISALFDSKWALWRLDEKGGQDYQDRLKTFSHLVETALKKDELIQVDKSAVTVEDVLQGRFHRCLELHLKILKLRINMEDQHE
jgi:hypothetical protein